MDEPEGTPVGIQVSFRGDVKTDADQLAAALNGPERDLGVLVTGNESQLQLGAAAVLVVLLVTTLGKAGLKVAIDRLNDWAKEQSKKLDDNSEVKVLVQIDDRTARSRVASILIQKGALLGMQALLQIADDVLTEI